MYKKIVATLTAGAAAVVTAIPAIAWWGPWGFGRFGFGGFGFGGFGCGFPFWGGWGFPFGGCGFGGFGFPFWGPFW